MGIFFGRVWGKREKRAGRRKERGGGAEKALHHPCPRCPLSQSNSPGINNSAEESADSHHSAPLFQPSILSSFPFAITRRSSLTQWPGFSKRHVPFNAPPQLLKASRACGNQNKKKLSKQSVAQLTGSQTLQKGHLLNQPVSNRLSSHCLTAHSSQQLYVKQSRVLKWNNSYLRREKTSAIGTTQVLPLAVNHCICAQHFNISPKPSTHGISVVCKIFEEEHIYFMCGRLTLARPSYTML